MSGKKNPAGALTIALLCVFAASAASCQETTKETTAASIQPASNLEEVVARSDSMFNEVLAQVEMISPARLKTMLDKGEKVTVLDICIDSEFDQGHIKGAVWLPRGKLEFFAGKGEIGEPDNLIVVVCKKGKRSVLATKTLTDLGFSNVKCLEGGLKAWVEAGLTIYNDLGEVSVERFMAREDE